MWWGSAGSRPCPEKLFGIPKIPNRKTSNTAAISPSFDKKFLFIKIGSQGLFRFHFFLGRSDMHDRCFGDFHAQIIGRHAEVNRIVFQRNDSASQAAAGGDLVAGLELVEHALPLFLTALLRENQEKIKNGENEDDGSDTEPSHTPATDLQRQ